MVRPVGWSRLVTLFIIFVIAATLLRHWAGNQQSLCVFEQFLDDRQLDSDCLTTMTNSRPYFDTIAAYQQDNLCEQECTLEQAADTRHIMQNYYVALTQPQTITPLAPQTLPSSLYLWTRSRDSQAEQHRALALRVDDVWQYDWQPMAAWVEQGLQQHEAGDWDAAETAYQTALQRAAESTTAIPRTEATAWAGLADIADKRGDQAAAINAIEKAIALYADDVAINALYTRITE